MPVSRCPARRLPARYRRARVKTDSPCYRCPLRDRNSADFIPSSYLRGVGEVYNSPNVVLGEYRNLVWHPLCSLAAPDAVASVSDSIPKQSGSCCCNSREAVGERALEKSSSLSTPRARRLLITDSRC